VAAVVEEVVFVVVTIEEAVVVVAFEDEVVPEVAAVVVDFVVVEGVATDIKKQKLFFFLPVICHFLYGNSNYSCCFFYSLYIQNKQHEKNIYKKINVFFFFLFNVVLVLIR
jgi:hypothetical protein